MLNQQTKTSRSRLAPLLFMVVFFSGTVFAAWAWFHIGVEQNPEDGIWLQVSTNVPGYTFKPEPISEGAIAILGTTNFINGVFYKDDSENPNADAIKVFFATWEAKDGKGLTVLHHTPDICWVGAGWSILDISFPSELAIPLGHRTIPVESQAFRSPNGNAIEVAAWAILVGGHPINQPIDLNRLFPNELQSSGTQARNARLLALGHLFDSIRGRVPAKGHKQFVRLSRQFAGDSTLETLSTIFEQSLHMHATE